MAAEGILLHFINQVLQAEREANVANKPHAATAATPNCRDTTFVEWCCAPQSHATAMWERCGGTGVRMTLPHGDVDNPQVVKKFVDDCRAKLRRGRRVAFHAAIPCKAWCQLQNLNKIRWPGFAVKLAATRAQSRRRVGAFTTVVKTLLLRVAALL